MPITDPTKSRADYIADADRWLNKAVEFEVSGEHRKSDMAFKQALKSEDTAFSLPA